MQGRLGFALAASLLAHGALLGALSAPPGAWHAASADPGLLHATLHPAHAEAVATPAIQPARARPAARASSSSSRYFEAHELDRHPQVRSHVEPQFPVLALGPTGRVVLRLSIDDNGHVNEVVVESDDPSGAFATAAREAFGAAQFLPGMRGGVPVKALVRIEVRFGSPHPDNVQ